MRPGSLALRALSVLGWVALAGVFGAAVHDASLGWDSWYYHLPFAARLAGVIPERSFVFSRLNEARYDGLPLLGELLQGALWRVTGHVEAANLVAFASVPLLAWFMKARWSVPFPFTALGLLAIPLVQTHASSAYVDLPANAAASVVALLVVDAYAGDAVSLRDVLLALAAGAVACNVKPLLQPIVGLALAAIFVKVIRARATRPLAWVMLLAAPVVLFTTLKDLYLHDNPFFPIHARILGHDFPGAEEPYASMPDWMHGLPGIVRFAASLAESHVRPLTDAHRWTVDQWMPDASGGNRLGGFFDLYVGASCVALVLRAYGPRARLESAALVVFAALTVVVAAMPQSHELRYYMCWMIVLVCLNLGLACRAPPRRRGAGLLSLAALSALCFVVVVLSTRGAYAYPAGMTVKELVAAKVDVSVLDRVPEGAHVCVHREPWNLLWTEELHPPRRYTVVEAEEDGACHGVPELGK